MKITKTDLLIIISLMLSLGWLLGRATEAIAIGNLVF